MTHRCFPLPLSSKRIIGPFQYYENKVLGRGSHSIAYQGKKINTNERVCVKQIMATSDITEYIANNEINALRRVKSPFTLKYFAHFKRGPMVYIVTELCQMDLLTKIRKQGKMPEKEALRLFLQILEGYEALRNIGSIHRDIKPDNIFIKDNQIKLGDFGYSTPLTSECIESNVNLGTPLYMAPQALSFSVYSEKSDIWSLGITLYEMLTGTTPFKSTSEHQLQAELKKPLRPLNCSESINRIVSRCLFVDVQNRIDLQSLLLEMRLSLSELTLRQRTKSRVQYLGKTTIMCLNELNYIRFLDYVQLLVVKTKNLSDRLRERIRYIIQWQTKVRLQFIEPLFSASQTERIPVRLIQTYKTMTLEHSDQLILSQELLYNDRLNFFVGRAFNYEKNLLWQSQAELKDLISQLFKDLSPSMTQYSVAVNQSKIKLLDFMVTTFLLNKMLILRDYESQTFARESNLETILHNPCRVNLKVYQKLCKKVEELNLK